MKPTERFSSRVADYVKFRPTYPSQIIPHLTRSGLLTPASVIADIGSGTGLLTRLFLPHAARVFGVEPNPEMRAAGEAQLQPFPNFTSLPATAEATTLPAATIDLVIAGQAFHWFDPAKTRLEFRRILRAPGYVALIWNERITTTGFLAAYEDFLKTYSTDYSAVDHRGCTPDRIAEFFHPHALALAHFPNQQHFDFQGLKGRVLSSSYSPPPGHPQHAPMLAALAQLFAAYQSANQVTFEYQTRLYSSRLLP